MAHVLILISSIDGQTHKIGQRIGAALQPDTTTLLDIHHAPALNLDDYDKIILGGSVRYGRHSKVLTEFLMCHHQHLNRMKTALFSVNASARKTDKSTPSSNPYFIKLKQQTLIAPSLEAVFAGKIHLSRYGFFDRFMIKMIFRMGGDPLKTDEVEFTNWSAVDDFIKDFQAL